MNHCLTFWFLNVQVPKEWKLDPDWDGETKHPHELSHLRRFPSKWRAAIAHQDPVRTVKIVDHFVIGRTDKNDCATTAPNGPVQWFVDLVWFILFVTLFRKQFEEMKKKKKKNSSSHIFLFLFSISAKWEIVGLVWIRWSLMQGPDKSNLGWI